MVLAIATIWTQVGLSLESNERARSVVQLG